MKRSKYGKEYNKKNIINQIKYQRRWNKNNKDYYRKYYLKNKAKYLMYQKKRRLLRKIKLYQQKLILWKQELKKLKR